MSAMKTRRILQKQTVLVLAALVWAFTGCQQKEDDPAPENSRVNTDSPTEIAFTSANFNGTILQLGTGGITDHGFVWGETTDPDLTAAGKQSLGAKAETGGFTHEVTGLTAGVTYHVRAYVTDAQGTFYGQNQTFSTSSVIITEFIPTSGTQGDTVTITGSNFTTTVSDVIVKIGDVSSSNIVSSSSTEIKAIIPAGVTEGANKISVSIQTVEGISTSDFTYLQGTWIEKKSLPSSIGNTNQSFVLGAAGFIVDSQSQEVWQYDPSTDSWQQKANFGGDARIRAASFVLNNKAYVGFGLKAGIGQNDFWEYDPLLNSWTQKNNFTSASSTYKGFTVNGKGYIVGSILGVLWEYDATNDSWVQKTSFPNIAAGLPDIMIIDNMAYVGGGNGSERQSNSNKFWKYNTTNDTWTTISDFPGSIKESARFRPLTSFATSVKGYVIEAGENYDVWEYDPTTDSWSAKAHNVKFNGQLPLYTQAFVINDKAYIRETNVNGGTSLWEFDPTK